MDDSFILWIIIGMMFLILFNTDCTGTQLQPVAKTPVTFINGNPGVTELGIVKFKMEYGRKVDYEIMNIHWDYKIYVIDLEPGVYGVTQYAPEIDKIVGYQTITVGNEPMIVKFRRL